MDFRIQHPLKTLSYSVIPLFIPCLGLFHNLVQNFLQLCFDAFAAQRAFDGKNYLGFYVFFFVPVGLGGVFADKEGGFFEYFLYQLKILDGFGMAGEDLVKGFSRSFSGPFRRNFSMVLKTTPPPSPLRRARRSSVSLAMAASPFKSLAAK